jgi:hypothetical protein
MICKLLIQIFLLFLIGNALFALRAFGFLITVLSKIKITIPKIGMSRAKTGKEERKSCGK